MNSLLVNRSHALVSILLSTYTALQSAADGGTYRQNRLLLLFFCAHWYFIPRGLEINKV